MERETLIALRTVFGFANIRYAVPLLIPINSISRTIESRPAKAHTPVKRSGDVRARR